jgi:hypothetical protein
MAMAVSIEDIILSHDRRGISALRDHLTVGFCHEAAAFVLQRAGWNKRRIIIATGFYVRDAAAPETDGPPGALAIGRALEALDFDVIYVTDRHTAPLLFANTARAEKVIDFPIADHEASGRFAREVLAEIQPSVLISIERPGLSSTHRYLNMAGEDITAYTAKMDYLFMGQENTVGIGDGGNEIGMGNLARHIRCVDTLPKDPAVTQVERLVIAAVSNWGGYGLIAAMSRLLRRNLLPSVQWEKDMIEDMVAMGAVDGVSGRAWAAVDGYDLEQNSWALTQLHRGLADMPPDRRAVL